MGTNLMITADAAFTDIKVSELGPLRPTRGFSSFKFVPGSSDQLVVALKSEEVAGRTATYITVLATEGGQVLLPETKIADAKFEGIEFV
jgi:soluble calcium-activated nucleotidase 1